MAKGKYNHQLVERKWQRKWEESGVFKTPEIKDNRNKRYVLDMFPYPSGATMHVGHLEGYVGTDILTRCLRMRGFSVLHPMGWDAFGLPAENYAIKTSIPPDKSTHDNIRTFKRQLQNSGLSYDWSREIDTSNPSFYKWTQWLFLLMFKRGLAYKKKAPVNFCPSCKTVLANEQVINGKCERCDTQVNQKELDQWFLKITDYADRLIAGLDKLDWPEEIKVQQKNWIGKSEGRMITFKVEGGKDIKVFTTRPDTLEGATFIAIPDRSKKDGISKEKIGRFTGKYAINPANGEKIPIWEANYIEESYGAGAIMGVPAYDERDMEFAKKYHIDIVKRKLNDGGWGEKAVSYHLRDWLISRQRYWGAPIPMIYCQKCQWWPVPIEDLPVLLPTDVDFLPRGESPIARSKTFQKGVKCPKCGRPAKREIDTMDTYVDSSWYFIRFVDPQNAREFTSPGAAKKWLPVDIYVGGGHVIQHLLFARFFWKVLFDEELIPKSLGEEPFLKLRAPGWILGPDSRKMGKRWNNVVTPDDIIPKFGADTLRVYEMFMGPFEVMKPWSIAGVEGSFRFLNRLWRAFTGKVGDRKSSPVLNTKLHQTIKKVDEDIEELKFNTAIAAMMEFLNLWEKEKKLSTVDAKLFAKLLAPLAPHLAEEVWCSALGEHYSVHAQPWPKFDPKLVVEKKVTIVVQVNGKVRGQLTVNRLQSTAKTLIEKKAKQEQRVSQYLKGQRVKQVVFVPGKLINFVTS